MSHAFHISILYVEDEKSVRSSVARSLSLIADHVYTAENGEDALLCLKTNPIDLIITDIRMPKLDGLSFVETLRNEGLVVPVIITSAFNETDYLQKAIDLNIEKFILKPIRLVTLMDAVTKQADIIENKRLLTAKIEELSRYRKVIEETNFSMYIDSDKKVTNINEALRDFIMRLGMDPDSIQSIDDIFQKQDKHDLMERVLQYKIFSDSVTLNLNHEKFSVLVTAFASSIEDDNIKEITILFKDITTILRDKEALIDRLYKDELTGLPNRQKLFYDLLQFHQKICMLLIDIDGFSKINHLYGFHTGDIVLKEVAKVLTEYQSDGRINALYKSDMDLFVVVIDKPDSKDLSQVEALSMEIIKDLESHQFVILDDTEINIGITIGASSSTQEDLYIEASLALEMAKRTRSDFKCFNNFTDMKHTAEKNLKMQNKIKKALRESKIINYYQSIVDSKGEVIKYEALVRMEDPDNGEILTPYQFLDIARESKNYPLLTKQVIKNAFADFGASNIEFSINLSFVDIINPEIVLMLEDMLKSHQGKTVTIELLEVEGLIDVSETIRFCKNMKSMGANIAIDDFGSGYSNFIYFFDIPIDILKIDGSLIKRVGDYRGYIALETIVEFARKLNIKTVAEFVEDANIFEKLKKLNLDMYQGYHFSKPKPLSAL
ncbi:EAL domain-containing protein [Sulfurospirillum sp. 1612]|uniref:EAL domain-containing protein n=1 Tax=Sulfurospirillum sp. 1612 TaxID=3094835 RepID=UPI002F958181